MIAASIRTGVLCACDDRSYDTRSEVGFSEIDANSRSALRFIKRTSKRMEAARKVDKRRERTDVKSTGELGTHTPVWPSSRAWKSLRKMLFRKTMLYRNAMYMCCGKGEYICESAVEGSETQFW